MQSNWDAAGYAYLGQDDLGPSADWDDVPQYTMFCEEILETWNRDYFVPRNLEAVFCRETASSGSKSFAIYITDLSTSLPVFSRFGAFLPPATGIQVYKTPDAEVSTVDGYQPWITVVPPAPYSPRTVHFREDAIQYDYPDYRDSRSTLQVSPTPNHSLTQRIEGKRVGTDQDRSSMV
jgi:hypothetical protein